MQAYFSWLNTNNIASDNWLVLGKGPSFDRLSDFDIDDFRIFALNHTIRERPADIAHVIDFEVILHCKECLLDNAGVVLMPWIPHQNNQPGDKTLEDYVEEDALLKELSQQGRLLWYALSTAGSRNPPGSPVIEAHYFSAEAAINLLAESGVKRIRTLGIDGGLDYADQFQDLNQVTKLSNSQNSFDKQFLGIARSIRKHNLDFGPLWAPSPANIYVGTAEEQMLAYKVLEYSIQLRTGVSVNITPLANADIPIPLPKDEKNHPRTPFSFQRFLIPQLQGFTGRAIYLDSDMLVLKNILNLWSIPFGDADILAVGETAETRKPQFSVMLLNCDTLRWKVDDIVQDLNTEKYAYAQLMETMPLGTVSTRIPSQWNSLEHYEAGETALLHYTDMTTQPWLARAHKYEHLWLGMLFAALDEGFISERHVENEVASGNIRPSILYQVRRRILNSRLLPVRVKRNDKAFRAPAGFKPKHQDKNRFQNFIDRILYLRRIENQTRKQFLAQTNIKIPKFRFSIPILNTLMPR